MTREEFSERLKDYGNAYMRRQEARSISIDSWAREAQEQMDVIEAALLAAYDAQAARIAELDAQCDKLASVLLKRGCDGMVSECAEMEARITELEREVHLVRERNAELAAQRLELDDRAYYEGRVAELEAQRDALLAACEAALEAIRSDADVDWMLNVESQCCAAIAKARGGGE